MYIFKYQASYKLCAFSCILSCLNFLLGARGIRQQQRQQQQQANGAFAKVDNSHIVAFVCVHVNWCVFVCVSLCVTNTTT